MLWEVKARSRLFFGRQQLCSNPSIFQIRMAGYPPEVEVEYTIGDNGFTGFMMGLRCILADHPDHSNILEGHCLNPYSTGRYPLLAKPLAEKPARWIHIRLQEVNEQGIETSSTTLVMRDDNVDVIGFRNNKGDWYELGNRRMLPPEYRSKLLVWGNRYESILPARNAEEAMDRLTSVNLGKSFAEDAVRVLWRFPDVAHGDSPRLAVVGLMFIVSESVKLNPVHDAIADGWNDTRARLTKQLMTDHVWRYVEMSRRLRRWKKGNYYAAQPDSELRAIYLVLNGNCEVAYTIGDEISSFISFMEAVRVKLAEHPDRQDILDLHGSTRNHPMLAKQRADGEQPARWIEVELQVVEDSEETTSTTLVIRDDNMDILGFMNQNGDWYELGNRRVLPPEYRSELLGWGNSYKSILGARNAVEVVAILTSANLGKSFATHAVRLLSCYPPDPDAVPAAAVALSPRLALVGLSVMVCDSARMNPVRDIIADGWNIETGYNALRMCCYIWKYKYMSRALRRWKISNYAEPRPNSQLEAIYLVLNEEYYIMGDSLSFAYPDVLNMSFPEMFKDMFMVPYTVKVNLRRKNKNAIISVHGKILAFISDEHRQSVPFRVGSLLFTRTTVETAQLVFHSEGSLVLERSVVLVPSGWVLGIDVDLKIKIPRVKKDKPLKATLIFDDKKTFSQSETPKGTGIEVEVAITRVEDTQHFPPQLSRPVEVEMVSWHPTVVYTIRDDAMSFIEFIIALRRILADHPGRKDILEDHKFLNLYSTREHPLLAKCRPRQPERWIHVKLQLEEGTSVTLVMRGDSVYVLGFFNQSGVLYKLLDNEKTITDIPEYYNRYSEKLYWGVSYLRLLEVEDKGYEAKCAKIAEKLTDNKLHSDFAMQAVRVLSSYPSQVDGIDLSPRVALAGLLVIVCESARMNPVCSSIAAGWTNGTTFTMEMIRDYLWEWKTMSGELWTWKTNGYFESDHLISQLQTIYLVYHAKGNGTASGSSGVPPTPLGRVVPTPGEAGGISSSGADSSPHVSPSPNTSQQGGRGNGGGPGPGPRKQAENARGVRGHGRPLVEFLAIRANLAVVGTTITVFDGKRGQIIYRKEQGDQKGMFDLVLTGPYTGISAYGCFAIEIDIPPSASSSTSCGVKPDSTKWEWEWDCDDPRHAAQVDTMRPAHAIITTSDGRKVAKVTYVVMSDALEATVQVKLRLKNGHSPGGISGKVTARIDGFKSKHKSVLFRRAKGKCQRFSTTNDNSWLLLELARNVVAVPRGRVLHIVAHLKIEADDGKKVEVKVPLRFENGICSTQTDDGKEVEVLVTWYPEIAPPSHPPEQITSKEADEHKFNSAPSEQGGPSEVKMVSEKYVTVVYTIGDELSFLSFIMDLRRKLTDHPDREDILDGHKDSNISSTREHPLLPKLRPRQPERWLHVKLQLEEGTSVTLVMRCDSVCVLGFFNQSGVLYKLLDNDKTISDIPEDYNRYSEKLYWGVSYPRLLEVEAKGYEAKCAEIAKELTDKKLHSGFAVEAVRVLSSYPQPVDGIDLSPRVALASLLVIVCESARMNPICSSITAGWTNGTTFTMEMVRDYLWKWKTMSGDLRTWKTNGYVESDHLISQLQAIYLVFHAKGDGTASGSSGVPPAPLGEVVPPPEEAGGISSSGADSSPHVSPSPSTSQQGGRGNGGGPGPGPRKQAVNAGDVQNHGRPLVELLAISANLAVDGTTITVFDGKRGQIIYRKEEEQGDQKGMFDLVLTGPYTGISAYGCFAIKIDIPPTASSSTSSGVKPDSTKWEWEWDCDDPNHAAQVDTMQPAHSIISSPDGRKVAEVTYAVMTDAREATVQIKLRLNSGHIPSCIRSGKITALIDGLDIPSVLLNCTEVMGGQCLSTSTAGDSWFPLQLARNVVAVPCCRVLHIGVNLQIETDDGMGIELKAHLSFDNGICSSKSETDDGNKVQVEVTWYPEQITSKEADFISGPWDWDWLPEEITSKEADEISTLTEQSGPSEVTTVSEEYETEVVYTIGDELSFLSFIMDLRRVAANHRDQREDILDRHSNSNLRSTREHPLLPRRRAEPPARWLHVKLEAVEGNETSSTTLAMRDDNLFVHGFMNQQGVWYGLVDPSGTSAGMLPPDEYQPQPLHWSVWYKSILRARASTEAVEKLAAAHLGRQFAMRAVRRLSSPVHPDDEVDGLMSARVALAGLMFMVCESARMNPVLDFFAGGWSTGTGFTKELITDYVQKYVVMSWRLLEWKRRNYPEPNPYSELRAIHLVLNRPSRPVRGVDV